MSLEDVINRVTYQINQFWSVESYKQQSVVNNIASLVSDLDRRYGELLGELKVKFSDKESLLKENAEKESNAFQLYGAQTRMDSRIHTVSRLLLHASELVSIAKTLESETKKEKTKIDNFDVKLIELEDRIQKLEKFRNDLEKNK